MASVVRILPDTSRPAGGPESCLVSPVVLPTTWEFRTISWDVPLLLMALVVSEKI